MIEATGNLWDYPANYRVITTNGTVKKNGWAVMGRGCAYEATQKFPTLAKELGNRLSVYGNKVWSFPKYNLITFPVKHHWYETADVELIKISIASFKELVDNMPAATFVMPRPGCGNGKLSWETVRPLLRDLPDNVVVITYDRN